MKKFGWLAGHIFLLIGLLLLLLWGFARGLDFTDEADSLLATVQPFAMTLRFSEYMFYTNWLYLLGGESLFWFRVSGLILLLLPAAYLAWQMVRCLQEWRPLAPQTGQCIFLCMLAASTAYYCKWYTAPNYYWMAQLGLTVVAACLLHISRLRAQGRFSAGLFILLGVALTITGLGRVTTVFLDIILVCVAVLLMFRHDAKHGVAGLALTGLTGLVLLLLHMAFVAGGVMNVAEVYLGILQPERASDRGSLATQQGYVVQAVGFLAKKSVQGGLVIVGVPLLAHWLWKSGRVIKYPVWMMGIVFVYYARYFFRDYGDPSEIAATMFSMALLSSLFFIILMPVARAEKKKIVVWSGLLFLLTASMGLGSAMPLLWGMSRSLLFLVAAVLMCLWVATAPALRQCAHAKSLPYPVPESRQGTAQGLSFLVMLTVVVILSVAVGLRPYRQPPLWQHTESVVLHKEKTIKLWPEAADFVQTLQAAAEQHGWKPGTVVLDYGADNAGIAYILGAATPGNGRIYGGYDNTDMFARIVTRCLSPEQKQKAWIVTSTDAEVRVSPKVVQELFPSFPQEYVKVWEHKNIGLEKLEETLSLWRPKA